MLMELGISPELTQAAYRVGDSTTNIITPLMPYFPLVVVFSQRYVKSTGIGTLVSMMLPLLHHGMLIMGLPYTLTELNFAEQRWKHPHGRVLPVFTEPTPKKSIPAFLRDRDHQTWRVRTCRVCCKSRPRIIGV